MISASERTLAAQSEIQLARAIFEQYVIEQHRFPLGTQGNFFDQ